MNAMFKNIILIVDRLNSLSHDPHVRVYLPQGFPLSQIFFRNNIPLGTYKIYPDKLV